jgi:ParB family chromosome partitioning protein
MPEQNFLPTKYDSVYWVEIDRIEPNPYQPRIEFDEANLKSLAESIRQYGVLQPLVVTSRDREKEDGGLQTVYELIAGERRLRASKLIGLREVPVVIRKGEQTDRMKLELAIIENLQREDLNAIDRAKALAQLAEAFGTSHSEIGAKIGRSREYVSNSIRLLQLPEAVQQAVVGKEITEGHARALLMLTDRPEERDTLFKEIVLKKTSVRVVEQMARRLAQDKIRKHDKTVEIMELEKSLTESLGTRVLIERRPNGGRLTIEFFSPEDLSHIAEILAERRTITVETTPLEIAEIESPIMTSPVGGLYSVLEPFPHEQKVTMLEALSAHMPEEIDHAALAEAQREADAAKKDEELYSVHNFTV